MKEQHRFTVKMLKNGKEPKKWHEMNTVNDIFQLACNLSKRDRTRMLNQFKEAMSTAVLLREITELETGYKDESLNLPFFKWGKP